MRQDAYPKPVASGGSRQTAAFRSLRGPPATSVRQPYLGSPPQVVSITGFGTGSGAFILNHGSDADQSQGLVAIRVGLNPAATGAVNLYFPIAPTVGQYWAAAEWAAPINPTVSVNNLGLGWTATRTLLPGELLRLAYQWTVST